MYEVLKAQQILEEKYGVAADVWSVTSYKELYRTRTIANAGTCSIPDKTPKVPYVTQRLKDAPGPFVAASDYMKVLAGKHRAMGARPLVLAWHRRLRAQ